MAPCGSSNSRAEYFPYHKRRDRALFGDEPLIVFIIIYCFLVFNFEFLEVLHNCLPFVCSGGNPL